MSVTAVLKLQRQRFVLLCVFQFLFLVLSGEAAAVWIVLYTQKTKHMVAKNNFYFYEIFTKHFYHEFQAMSMTLFCMAGLCDTGSRYF